MNPCGDLQESTQQLLCRLIEARIGLRFHEGNSDLLRRALVRVGADGGAAAVGLYAELMASPISRPVWQRLIAEIAVGETYFFRHPEDFAALERRVVPALLASGTRTVRAWSVGCSTGEEVYSLAVCLAAAAPLAMIEVIGTDINQAALAVAEKGVYKARSLRGAAPSWEAVLTQNADADYQVPAEIRARVRFAEYNLAATHPPSIPPFEGGCHVIFCRNVLVYFGAARAAQVLAQLGQCLSPGGSLFVSPLDLTHRVPGLSPVELDGVWLFSKMAPRPEAQKRVHSSPLLPPIASPTRPTSPPTSQDPVGAARAAADRGDLAAATQIASQAVLGSRTPELLHLLALILGEQGQQDEMLRLLEEAVALSPGYVLGHLSLGLVPKRGRGEHRAAHHLSTVLTLLERRADDEILEGPERLRVAMARRLAQQGLANIHPEGRP